jgi:anti-anti-sigma factor
MPFAPKGRAIGRQLTFCGAVRFADQQKSFFSPISNSCVIVIITNLSLKILLLKDNRKTIMELLVRMVGKWAVARPSGRLSESSSLDFENACLEKINEGNKWLAFDLSDVSYINSADLRVLIYCQKLLKERNGGIAVLSPQSNVQEAIEVCGLHRLFPLLPGEAELPQ